MAQVKVEDFATFLSRKAKGKPIVHFNGNTWRAGPHTVQITLETFKLLVDGGHAKADGDPAGEYPNRLLRMK